MDNTRSIVINDEATTTENVCCIRDEDAVMEQNPEKTEKTHEGTAENEEQQVDYIDSNGGGEQGKHFQSTMGNSDHRQTSPEINEATEQKSVEPTEARENLPGDETCNVRVDRVDYYYRGEDCIAKRLRSAKASFNFTV